MIKCFIPIISNEPKILILGSIPSIASLEKQEYYGFKQNRFWKIISHYFHLEFNTYEDKIKGIKKNGIALWDVIANCDREGSLDVDIKNEECNDIEGLLKDNPTIKYILCNGQKSYTLYQKHFSHLLITCISLPSTSNANRSIKEEELIMMWISTLDRCFKK